MATKNEPTDLFFYTIDDVAAMLKVTPRTIQNWIKQGKLHSRKFGGTVRISRQDILIFTQTGH